MPVYLLAKDDIAFPPADLANEDGILALGGDLSVPRLIEAYQNRIFPWFNDHDPFIWWSPDPRFVLYPKYLKVAKSMRSYFNQKKFQVTVDQQFETVMRNCQQAKREGQGGGTWITESMIEGYVDLHHAGYAHSVEVWKGEALVGGLYGVALGKVFFGESMFSKASNASKFGFISLVRALIKLDFDLIDCQQKTQYLGSLGAKEIPRKDFLQHLELNKQKPNYRGDWGDLLNF
ncbi:MAG: leucyl/phenylalanyl-tRNA--protein transferase [Saprospiraceae bacterium]